jgi:hypothetical protein
MGAVMFGNAGKAAPRKVLLGAVSRAKAGLDDAGDAWIV